MTKKRIDTGPADAPLSDNPFAGLGDMIKGDLPTSPPEESKPEYVEILKVPYAVGKTRKGGWALSLERRAKGSVTVLGNVTGDGKALLKALRKHCGAGGVFHDDRIEIQGDQREAIERFLKKNL
jgi:hypothetical protein